MTGEKRMLKTLLLVCVIALLAAVRASAGPGDCTGIETEYGTVNGAEKFGGRLCEYLGIPYAAPPVDELRFRPPAPHTGWQEPLDAVEYSPMCMQYPLALFEESKLSGSEDCLTMNIWRPTKPAGEKLPVMVFIHGGGFKFGSSSEDIYDGGKLAGMGRVLVASFNYRLGPIGFFGHPALMAEDGPGGNYGILDQFAALEWVKENIAAFGGDPDNITVFGESAGGMSLGLILASPDSEGLFQRAVIESGPMVRFGHTPEKAAAIATEMAEEFGCAEPASAAECLRKVPAERFFDFVSPGFSMTSVSHNDGGAKTHSFRPVIENEIVPDNLLRNLERGEYNKDVDVIMGFNSDEASLFTLATKINTAEEYRKEVGDILESRGASFGIGTEYLDEIMRLYPADAYETPSAAFVDLSSDMAFSCPAVIAADIMSGHGTNVWLYEFGKGPSNLNLGVDLGAFHAVELFYIFGNFRYLGFNIESKSNKAFSRKVLDLWSSFSREGEPRSEWFPQWPPYETGARDYIYINEESAIRQNYKKEQCDFFRAIVEKL